MKKGAKRYHKKMPHAPIKRSQPLRKKEASRYDLKFREGNIK
jgi:hypothetical protein